MTRLTEASPDHRGPAGKGRPPSSAIGRATGPPLVLEGIDGEEVGASHLAAVEAMPRSGQSG
ncbi:MAG: hypothetical protein AVDCRST_MAG49-4574 [uncultured Thermomicrobiales bacterium]|uniref:Uncharacterized protein n=1 Tax=uncultured Thermomicrobiales bacterium TaxID=1645740 RepID=A0A6J4VKQ8_9BACT|nr:MAG: hypothetical protein AVDCRST_MAG49-4574 [uncultured Thermomicrobiales bacterium]